MARAQGARAQMALGFETVYGTPPAASDFWKMPFASSNLGAEQPLLSSELLGYGRDPLPPVKDAITADGDVVIPIDARFFGIWLKALFGQPTTTEDTGVFTHVYQSGGWTLPSFAVEIGMPEVPYFSMVAGCVANSISWTMNRSGLITATVNVIAQGEAVGTTSSAGTLAELALARFGAFNGAVKRNGALLGNITSAEVTYSNNLDRIETIRDDGKIDGADPSIAALTGTINVRFANTDLLDQAVDGDPCELEFSYGTSATSKVTLTAHAVYLPKPKVALEGPAGVQLPFAWQAAKGASPARMCTVELVNDQASYNNP
ncbi:MAG TPA: phage tail tube protein [Novosphingobium sp.]|jgi:hypothetical protein|nr:phage tail tube protein [Novosphingobium sp.]